MDLAYDTDLNWNEAVIANVATASVKVTVTDVHSESYNGFKEIQFYGNCEYDDTATIN